MHTYIANSKNDIDNLLPIRFTTVGKDHKQEYINNRNGFKVYQILIIQDGHGIVKCNGEVHELSKGSAFLNFPHIPVEYINKGGLVTAFITAQGSALRQLSDYFNEHKFIYRSDINTDKYIKSIDGIIKEYREYRRQSVLSKLTYSLFVDFFEESQVNDFTIADKAALYIEKHFHEKITLQAIASIYKISVSKLCHDFKASKNCTVFDYILNMRLSYAQNLLLSFPSLTIKEISVQCGFEDVSYFCKAFKEMYNLTPSQYKKLNIK